MVKGCQRRMIMVKDTKSSCFDAAYFVLRSDAPAALSDAEMLNEAMRMIDACSVTGCLEAPTRRRSPLHAIIPAAAALLGMAAGAAAMLLCG